MANELEPKTGVHIHRDERGVARELLHADEVHISTARTPQQAAADYLERFGSILGIDAGQVRVGLAAERRAAPTGIEYRFHSEASQFDTTTVTFVQTLHGLPVWEAGLAVHVRSREPFLVESAQSTLHADLAKTAPELKLAEELAPLTTEDLARALGLEEKQRGFNRKSLRIERQEFYIYRYDETQRTRGYGQEEIAERRAEAKPPEGSTAQTSLVAAEAPQHLHGHQHAPPRLPPVPKTLVDGRHYPVVAVYFVLGVEHIPELRWVALVEASTRSILMLRAFVDSVVGQVFMQDPMTTNGGPAPSAGNAALNPLRRSVVLPGLLPPLGGNMRLKGELAAVLDVEPPPDAPPLEPVGTDFNFDARTNRFAAVNAYFHTDQFFRLVRGMGFPIDTYFTGTAFPSPVDHRGFGSGPIINAHCLGNGSFGIQQSAYALADITNIAQPLGLVCDWRVVLHELGGHGILYNHVNSANFGFSHSAGDSFAAILNDPGSQSPDRFLTFPWVNIGRRHDRTPAGGWGWSGNIALNPFNFFLDLGGYNNEQILATTHFRIYRAIGGDSTEHAVQEFAARYASYLILRTIGGLTHPTNPPNAGSYAAALIAAERGSWTSEGELGGCYWKVVRWAFERQGLFQLPLTPKPNNLEGAPPPIDIYIDDGRHGEYGYSASGAYPELQKFWTTTDIWNRHAPDGQAAHQTPLVGEINHAYVRIKNRGFLAAHDIQVRGWHCRPTAGLVWPDDLKPMRTASLLVANLPSGGEVVVGPFEWRPDVRGHECMFMSAGAPGDRANNDPATSLPCAAGPTPMWRLVPCDNNEGLRAVIPVPGGGRRKALVAAFRRRKFWAANPFPRTAKMEVRAILPPFLASRGWAVRLDNPGGGDFSLGPRATRVIRPRLIGGQNFTAAEVSAAGQVAIDFVVLADGLVVGGLQYVLDPSLKEPAREVVVKDCPPPPPVDCKPACEAPCPPEKEACPSRVRVEIDLRPHEACEPKKCPPPDSK